MEDKFKKQILDHEIYLKRYNSIFNLIGNLKIIFFLLFAISIYFLFSKGIFLNEILISLGIFIILVALFVHHSIIFEKVSYYKGIIEINKKSIDRINLKWDSFKDTGREFIDHDHAYALDLDIVGDKSLFQLVNSTNTWHGRQALSKDLLNQNYDKEEILLRQEGILELVKNIEFSNKIQYYLSKIDPAYSVLDLVNELKDDRRFINSKFIKIIMKFLPIITVFFVILVLIFNLTNLYFAISLVAFIQCLIWVLGIKKIAEYLGSITELPYKLSSYSAAIDIIEKEEFTSKKLLEIKSSLCSLDVSASKAIKELGRITNRINSRNNEMLYFILNILLWWDYNCAIMLEEWKIKYSSLSEDWFLKIGELESLISFANLPNACKNMSVPNISTENNIIKAVEIGHPLISNEIRICNDIESKNNILIISGSNMSGKTTFLRTIGINMVLAQAGSLVCAKEMTFSFMKMFTSMRISDDLNEGVSTFYAELKRIKSIIDLAINDDRMIFLIDEIFRGTNSVDRLYGAKCVIAKLCDLKVTGIISTHDLELCELSNSNFRIKNYSFSEFYKDNKIYFDYKIKEGKSRTTNAKHLMEMLGII